MSDPVLTAKTAGGGRSDIWARKHSLRVSTEYDRSQNFASRTFTASASDTHFLSAEGYGAENLIVRVKGTKEYTARMIFYSLQGSRIWTETIVTNAAGGTLTEVNLDPVTPSFELRFYEKSGTQQDATMIVHAV